MCKCTPSIRTPYCGKGNCLLYPQETFVETSMNYLNASNEYSLNTEFFPISINTQNPMHCHRCVHKKHHRDDGWCNAVKDEPTTICPLWRD
jgi:hypothetical protein